MDPASTSLRVIRSIVGKADDAPRAIRAYHGSPHSFSRFDASKIGTGEGSQAYGHGLYFAGNEDVARSYRDSLAGLSVRSPDGSSLEIPTWISRRMIEEDGPAAWRDRLLGVANEGKGDADRMRSYAEAMRRLEGGGELVDTGHMYEVQIDYPEEALLDLDAPVRSQPQGIQDALGVFGEAPGWFSMGQDGWTGKNAYTRMAGVMAERNPRIVGGYHVVHDMPAASSALRQSGVPGIRYLDQGSRSAGQGTHNYVMFPGTEDRIKIMRQYGLLPPLLAPALMEDE